jgi:hypothetical protein
MGQIIYNITAGVPNFTASLIPSALPDQTHTAIGIYSFFNVPNGAYTLRVIDGEGCIFTIPITINECILEGNIICDIVVDCILNGTLECEIIITTTTTQFPTTTTTTTEEATTTTTTTEEATTTTTTTEEATTTTTTTEEATTTTTTTCINPITQITDPPQNYEYMERDK